MLDIAFVHPGGLVDTRVFFRAGMIDFVWIRAALRRLPAGSALAPLVRDADRGRRARPLEDAGDGDQRQQVRQRLEEHRQRVGVDRQPLGDRAREAEQERRREEALRLQLPKISAASAMKPMPAVMFSLKELAKPIERKAPPSAASMPERITAV